jgi:Divergent InlB B-repeat domain
MSVRGRTGDVRKRLSLGAAVAAFAVTCAFGSAEDSAGAAVARDRAVTDMPDEISGPQVHFLYVVPSGGADGQLDTNGVMEQSIARIERWFVKQAGNQGLRIDTYKGVPDITFVRLQHSAAQATAANPWPLWVIGEDLVAAGFNNPTKVYAAFYDGPSAWACGGAKSPALPKLAAMYLRAQPTGATLPCSAAPGFGTGTDRPGYFEIGLLHEILHVIGFSPPCAPHASASAFPDHVNDSPTDLMYGPDATHTAGWNWANSVLDFNRDDYYRANVPGCPDLSNSPYLTSLHSVSVTVNGPGTVTSSPAGIDCPAACNGMFPRSVTLTATPSAGAAFRGWTGVCNETAPCSVAGEGSASASFSALSHRRTLTLRVRGLRAAGALRVLDGYERCRERVPVIVERRAKQGWSIIRRVRTDKAGLFTAPLPKGHATYRAHAPELMANGERCVKTVSRTARSSSDR